MDPGEGRTSHSASLPTAQSGHLLGGRSLMARYTVRGPVDGAEGKRRDTTWLYLWLCLLLLCGR